MSPKTTLLLVLLASAALADDETATATMPLAEVLRLNKAAEEKTEHPPQPPVAAAVTRLELGGRVLEQALDLTAEIEVEVLATQGWATVPLLAQDPGLHITDLPRIDDATLLFKDGQLCLVSGKPGRYAFTLPMIKRAALAGMHRRVELGFAPAAYAVLRVRSDDNLFRVDQRSVSRQGDALVFYPQHDRFVVEWDQTAPAKAPAQAGHPPIDPVITAAHASVVGTLAGSRIARVRYDLRFEGTRELHVHLPQRQTLTKVYLNGAPVDFKVTSQAVALQVTPARAGDQQAVVELVLTEPVEPYHLSGSIALEFPHPDWTVHEMYATLHLPQVFNYNWAGGSLALTDEEPAEPAYTYTLPTPGKALFLHQELVTDAAGVRVSYDVALTDKYFK